jgi:hypothetical protein
MKFNSQICTTKIQSERLLALGRRRSNMLQNTNESQTAKLVELGFEKPKNERWVLDVANESTPSIQNVVKR